MAASLKMNLYEDGFIGAVEKGRLVIGGDPKIED